MALEQTTDLRPRRERWLVMKGDPFSLKCEAGPEETPEDLTGATITAKGKYTYGENKGVIFDLDVTNSDLAAGVFWVGVESVVEQFDYSVQITPAAGLPLTRWRGSVDCTAGADDA